MAGISPSSNPQNVDLMVNKNLPVQTFYFNIEKIMPQFFAGVKVSYPLNNNFFIESGATYTKVEIEYRKNDIGFDETHSMHESEERLQFPITIGVDFGALEITSGWLPMFSLTNHHNLNQIPGFVSSSSQFKLGWSMGARVNILQARIGLEYQGQLSRYGKGWSVNDQSLELRNVPGHFVFTVQYRVN